MSNVTGYPEVCICGAAVESVDDECVQYECGTMWNPDRPGQFWERQWWCYEGQIALVRKTAETAIAASNADKARIREFEAKIADVETERDVAREALMLLATLSLCASDDSGFDCDLEELQCRRCGVSYAYALAEAKEGAE